MAEAMKDLKDLKGTPVTAKDVVAAAPVQGQSNIKERKVDDLGRAYATGRRKESVARVWLKKGSGKVVVTPQIQARYFCRQTH